MLEFITTGLLDLPVWGLVAVTLLFTHITIVTVTVYLHRGQAHRALELHPALNHFFRFWQWLTTGMVTKEWAAIHRKHHAKCETPDDPHSPQIFGINKVLWDGVDLYKQATTDQEIMRRYGHGTPDDWLEHHIYTPHRNIGVSLMLVIDLLLFGVAGLAVWAIQMLWIPFFAAGVINGVGHYWGYRSYETRDASTNIVPWAIVIGGEELHNNHHAFPSSAKLSSKWWEFDLGWFYIRLLETLGLARVKKVAPKPKRIPGKQTIDLDTLRAVVMNRVHVMADFGRIVVVPVLKEELKRADDSSRRFLKRAKAVLLREDSRLDPQEHDQLQEILTLSQRLRTVYEYRLQLQAIWNRTTASHDKLMVALQDWCVRAEASGIHYLQEFARTLRSYSTQSA